MEQIVYTSRACNTVSAQEVFSIIETSARNNPARDVTGFLVYTGTEFLQLVEGPTERLDELLTVLKRDVRHSDVRILLRQPISQRCFPNWRMQRFDAVTAEPAGIIMTLKIARVGREVLREVEGFLLRQREAA